MLKNTNECYKTDADVGCRQIHEICAGFGMSRRMDDGSKRKNQGLNMATGYHINSKSSSREWLPVL
jgi:hypothetical protein